MKVATICYIYDKDKVLMIHKIKDGEDFWNGVGGKVEPNESPEECVIREVQEETGLTIASPKLKGINTFANNYGLSETWYVFVYTADLFSGELTESSEGELEWIPRKDLYTLSLQSADKHFLPWLEKQELFSAKFVFRDGEVTDHAVTFY